MDKWDLDRLNYLFNDFIRDYETIKKENEQLKDNQCDKSIYGYGELEDDLDSAEDLIETYKANLKEQRDKYNDLKESIKNIIKFYEEGLTEGNNYNISDILCDLRRNA